MDRLTLALQLLTRLPLKKQVNAAPADYAACSVWFFLPALLVGALMAAFYYIGILSGISYLAAFLSVFAACVMTGGLHVDGFADMCDAFFARKSKEETLILLKDSRMGVYGVLGIVFLVGIKTILIANIGGFALSLLLAMPVCGKIPMVFCAKLSQYPREDGLGKFMIELMTGETAFLSMLWCSIIVLFLTGFVAGAVAIGMNIAAGVLLYLFSGRVIGGATGDVLGACNEVGEVIYLVSAVVF